MQEYLDLVDRARERVPGITLASDFIVGFCGETDAEFAETVSLVERCRFKNIFVFKYSQRPATVAAKRIPDDVPDAVKKRRNNELLDIQAAISLETNRGLIGTQAEVLVEGYSKHETKAQEAEQARGQEVSPTRTGQLVGRTDTDRIVVFTGAPSVIGRFVRVRIKAATVLTLHGDLDDADTCSPPSQRIVPSRLAVLPPGQ